MSGFGYCAYKIGTKKPSNDPADYGLPNDVDMAGPCPLATGIIDWNVKSTYPPAKKHCIAVVEAGRVYVFSGEFTEDFKAFIDFRSKCQIPCVDIVAWVDTTDLSISQINDAMSDVPFIKSLLIVLLNELKYKPENSNEE